MLIKILRPFRRLPCKRLTGGIFPTPTPSVLPQIQINVQYQQWMADKISPAHDSVGWEKLAPPRGVGLHAINWHKLASRRRISRCKVSGPNNASNVNFRCTEKKNNGKATSLRFFNLWGIYL